MCVYEGMEILPMQLFELQSITPVAVGEEIETYITLFTIRLKFTTELLAFGLFIKNEHLENLMNYF